MPRRSAAFLLRFIIALVALYLLVAWTPVNDRVVVPFTHAVALASSAAVRTVTGSVRVEGTTIVSPRFAIDVKNGCNGIEAVLLLLPGVIAFPAPFRARLVGLTGGFLVIEVLNVLRLASLFWIGEHRPSLFDLFHVSIWQTVIVLVTIIFFVAWAARVDRATNEPPSR